jgi:hypothetical protein
MKYIAPAVLNTVNATNLIQGSKASGHTDSSNPMEFSNGAAYDADE